MKEFESITNLVKSFFDKNKLKIQGFVVLKYKLENY
jgi:hypothetical protein